jgi:hypothetical protein
LSFLTKEHFIFSNKKGDKPMSTRYISQELSTKLTAHIEELAKATDAARVSKAMLAYLDMCARFHTYSPQNLWLILLVKPDAIHVAGYKRWQSMGRYVRKGEKGIPILAHIVVKTDKDDGEGLKLGGFTVIYVCDLSQTGGDLLPEQHNWKVPGPGK